ncbi:hypothetical protein C5689_09885 [Methylosinus sporium]|uniref:Uncharacterized protein n=1 Tax=Methylosinus sporium TaxID=428 RepID=A0A2U1SR16_METSR|nr:hypothetical protein C5689_09885 [Methylosinus sporium]
MIFRRSPSSRAAQPEMSGDALSENRIATSGARQTPRETFDRVARRIVSKAFFRSRPTRRTRMISTAAFAATPCFSGRAASCRGDALCWTAPMWA